MYAYAVEVTPDDNDTFLVTCPALPEVATFGETWAGAMEHASDAIVEALAGRMAHKMDIPAPTNGGHIVSVPSRVAMKVHLYSEMRRQAVTKYRLAKILEVHQPQVDRLLDVRHNTSFDTMDTAMAALNMSYVIAVKETETRAE